MRFVQRSSAYKPAPSAGSHSNRAEGVRWALACIRERPAYAQFREHIGKIDELKAQF
jgi:hypothetical protein